MFTIIVCLRQNVLKKIYIGVGILENIGEDSSIEQNVLHKMH